MCWCRCCFGMLWGAVRGASDGAGAFSSSIASRVFGALFGRGAVGGAGVQSLACFCYVGSMLL